MFVLVDFIGYKSHSILYAIKNIDVSQQNFFDLEVLTLFFISH